MMSWIIAAAFFAFILWRIKRAKEDAAERHASGELRSPLYWAYGILAMSVLALGMYMAYLRPLEIHWTFWPLIIALFAVTLLVRRALKWRYPH